MQKKPLTELLSNIEQEMLRLHYNNATMQFYRRRWRMLLQFAQERGEIFYSERLGMDFVEKHFHILEKDFNRTLSQSNAQNLRIIRMIGDFQLHHTVLRRYYKHKAILIEPSLIALNNRFKSYCSSKEYSKVTTDHYIKQSARFMDYLASQKVTDYRDLNLPLIHAYIKTLAGYTYKTVEQVICSLRAFDQGSEFARYKELEKSKKCQVYFCNPHSPWQRGSNENTNGRLRRYLPRNVAISKLEQNYVAFIAKKLNNIPRKVLNYSTPAEVFKAHPSYRLSHFKLE